MPPWLRITSAIRHSRNFMLNVSIINDTEGELYTLEIKNTTPSPKEEGEKGKAKTVSHFASYTATLSGRDPSKPLTVRLRKYNAELGAVKLTARVFGRLFRKHSRPSLANWVSYPAPFLTPSLAKRPYNHRPHMRLWSRRISSEIGCRGSGRRKLFRPSIEKSSFIDNANSSKRTWQFGQRQRMFSGLSGPLCGRPSGLM